MLRLLKISSRINRILSLVVASVIVLHEGVCQQQSKPDSKSLSRKDYVTKSNSMILKNNIYSENFFNVVIESGKCSATQINKVRYYVNFGIALLAKGSYSLALEKFHKALELVEKRALDFDIELIKFNIAIVKIGLNRFDESLDDITKLSEAKFANFGYHYYKGMAEMALNRLDDAVLSFEKELKTASNTERTHYALAALYAKRNDWSNARNHIQQTDITYNRIDELLLFGNIHLYSQEGRSASKYFRKIEDAADKYTSFRKSNQRKISVIGNSIPFSSLSYHLVRSVTLAGSGDGSAVKTLIEDKSAQTHYCALFTIANDYFKAGNYRDAEMYFKKAIDKNKNDAAAYLGLGIAQLKQQEYTDAIIQFSKAISENGNLLAAYEARLIVYYILEKYEECISDYTTLRLKNNSYKLGYDALICVGFYKFSFGFQDEAKELFQQAINRFPQECGGYAGMGIYLMQTRGDAKGALNFFNKAIAADRSESLGYVNRANSMYTLANDFRYNDIRNRKRQRYVRRANKDFDRAIEIDLTNAAAFNGKAMLILNELMAEASQKRGKSQDSNHWRMEFAKVDSLVQLAINANRTDKRSTNTVRNRTEYAIILNHAFMVGNMAATFKRMNNSEMAKQLLSKSLEITRHGIFLSPSDSGAFWLNYSVSCSGTEQFEKAMQAAMNSMEGNNLCAAQNNLAFYNFNIGKSKDAESLLHQTRDCYSAFPQYVELINRNLLYIHKMSSPGENYTLIYDYEPILDWRPANLRFNLTIPPYRFEPNVLLILQNLAIDNKSDGPCVRKNDPVEKPPRFKDFKADDDAVPPCPGSNKRKKTKR